MVAARSRSTGSHRCLWGGQERVERTSNYVDLTRRAGTQLLLLKERWSTWGPTGDKAVASVLSAK